MKPILINIPHNISTARLSLRAPDDPNDGTLVNQAIRESISELKEWLPFAQQIPTLEESKVNLRRAYHDFITRERLRFLIFTKVDNVFIGVISLESIDWQVRRAEIGYWLHTQYNGHGYMKEAVDCITQVGFHILHMGRLEIRCESTNRKSRAIPEKLGFKLEATLRNDDLSADGRRLTDTCIYAKLNE